MKYCKLKDCTKPYHSKGYCSMHYSRITRYGRTTTVRRMDGLRYHPLYPHWKAMMTRCYNPKSNRYSAYGGRGIKVCERWRTSVKHFISDMGDKPSPDFTIDRINNDGDYEPSNCRWADKYQQARNKRISNPIGVAGVYWDKARHKWVATMTIRGSTVLRKRFDTLPEAINARRESELKHL